MTDEWVLTSGQVAEMLGIDRVTVHRISPDLLPYRATPGGSVRSGRRKYRAKDVEACKQRLASEGLGLGEGEELRVLRGRLGAIEAQLREALDRIAAVERRET